MNDPELIKCRDCGGFKFSLYGLTNSRQGDGTSERKILIICDKCKEAVHSHYRLIDTHDEEACSSQ